MCRIAPTLLVTCQQFRLTREVIMTTMKLLAKAWFVALFVAATALSSGCASDKPAAPPPPQKPAPQPVSLSQIKSELLQSKAQIQTTTDSLATLEKSPAADASSN